MNWSKKIGQLARFFNLELQIIQLLGFFRLRNKIMKHYMLVDQARNLKNEWISKKDSKNDSNKKNLNKVVFFSVRGGSATIVWESLIAKSLQLRNNDIIFILCDGLLKRRCEIASNNYRAMNCKACYYFGTLLLEELDLPYIGFGEFFNKQYEKNIENNIISNYTDLKEFSHAKYMEVKIGAHAKASTLRFLGRGTLENNGKTFRIFKEYLRSSIVSTIVANNVIDKLNPFRIVTSHGIYVSWGPILELANKKKVPIIVFDRSQGKMNLMFNRGKPNYENEWSEIEDDFFKNKLKQIEETALDTFLNERWIKGSTILEYNKNPIQNNKNLISSLDLNPEKDTFALFSNVLWDAANVGRDLTFENPLDWIIKTIKWFGNQNKSQLIVKIHPAEELFRTYTVQKVLEELNSIFETYPMNVKIIPAKTKINTYDVIDNVDYCIVHTSTVGLEAALRGKPVIVISNTHYRGKGFTFDVNDANSYFNLLSNPHILLMTKNDYDIARRYAYFYFIRRLVPFPFLEERIPIHPEKFKIRNFKELIDNEVFSMICEGILNYTPILNKL